MRPKSGFFVRNLWNPLRTFESLYGDTHTHTITHIHAHTHTHTHTHTPFQSAVYSGLFLAIY